MSSATQHSRITTEEAAEWLLELQAQPDSMAVRGQFVDWLRRSPVHVEEFLRLLSLQAELAALPTSQQEDAAALIAAAQREQSSVVPLYPVRPAAPTVHQRPASARFAVRAALAACLLLALGAVLLRGEFASRRHTQRFATRMDEVRAMQLADGSRIHMNSSSQLAVHIDPSRRELQLEAGEALFEVAHDPAHPFRVHTPNAVIIAHGTQFDVRVRDGQTEVVLLEGNVEVESPTAPVHPSTPGNGSRNVMLRPGQAVTVTDPAAALLPRAVDVAEATAWLRHLLVFDDATLLQVAAEFNLHAAEPLVIDDPAVADMRVTLSLDSADPQLLASMIGASGNLRVTRGADGRWHITRP